MRDYEAEGLLVYMKDLKFDDQGYPIILHVTSGGWEPGPANSPRTWRVACWDGATWQFHAVTESDNNYDTGCILGAGDEEWSIIGLTETGPQPYNPGGEMALWASRDQGATWVKEKQLTQGSPYNHSYARSPLKSDPGFWAFWADGHGRKPSESRLYFYDAERETVFRLPPGMAGEAGQPEPL